MSSSYEYDEARMVRVYYDGNAPQYIRDFLDGWLDGWSSWETMHGPNEPPVLRDRESSGEQYYTASWWFSFSHDRAALLDPLIEPEERNQTGTLEGLTWARVLFHDCTHPGVGDACS